MALWAGVNRCRGCLPDVRPKRFSPASMRSHRAIGSTSRRRFAAINYAGYALGDLMNSDEWDFKEAPWWDGHYEAIKFTAVKAGVRHICAISQITLNDYFETPDTQEDAFKNYHEHADMVHSLAVRVIEERAQNEQGIFFITSDLWKKYWP
jgi:hypothetical protein